MEQSANLNIDFEEILLKNLLVNNRFLGVTCGFLNEESFSNIANKELFKIIKKYYLDYSKAPNLPEIITDVKNISNSELRGLIGYQLKRIQPQDPITNEDFLIKQTVDFAKKSAITSALMVGAEGISKNSEPLQMKAYAMMEEAQKIRADTNLGLSFSSIHERIEYYKRKLIGLTTKHEEFDKRLGAGFLPKTLSILAAPPGIGKSLLLCDLASSFLLQKKNVLLITLEMSDFETVKRIDANALDLPINQFKDLDDAVILNAYNNIKNTVGEFYAKEYAPGVFSPIMLKGLLDSYRIEKGITFDTVLIDYIGLMKSDRVSPIQGPYIYLKSIAEEVRAIAVDQNIPIISPAQLNRGAINNLEADNSSMAESAGILQTADFILLLLQTPEMKEKKEYIFKVTKNRFTGRTDSWSVGIDYEKMRFADLLISSGNSTVSALPKEIDTALNFNESTGTLNNTSALDNFDFSDL
jgi:replicative DNA helicase